MRRILILALCALLCLGLLGCSGGGATKYTDRLLVARGTGLSELSLASGQEEPLVTAPEHTSLVEPAISPDGTRIAYILLLIPTVTPGVPTDLGGDLFIANRDGSNPTMVLQHRVRNEQIHSPAWLPEGKSLVVSIYTFGTRQLITSVERLDLATGALTPLAANAYQPAVSHDGARIAFLRTEADYTVSLWSAKIDGSGEEKIGGALEGLVSFTGPRFSPDGRYLAFGGAGQGQPAGGLAPAANPGRALALAQSGGSVRAAAAAIRPNGLPEDIWVLDLSTKTFRRMAQLGLDSPSVAWASDSRQLFVFADKGLYVIDVKNARMRRLQDGAYHGQMDWLGAR